MKIHMQEIERMDVLEATVTGTGKSCTYLSLDNLEVADNEVPPMVRLYDWGGKVGDKLLVSVAKISDDLGYIRVRLDSLRQESLLVA